MGFSIVLFQIVVKPPTQIQGEPPQFQYCVILDSSKTYYPSTTAANEFQYCVILDSSKTY